MDRKSSHIGFASAILLAFATACAGPPPIRFERPPIRIPFVERTSESSVRIEWPVSFSEESVAIFAGTDPDAIDRAWPLVVSPGRSARLTEKHNEAIGGGQRLYYELVPTAAGESIVVTERRLPLDCCDNFRDLGGYRSSDGRRVRWNRVYRANDLSKLGGDDLEYLSQFDIKLICDFRSNREQVAKPDREIDPATQKLSLPIDQAAMDAAEIQRKIRTGGMVGLGAERIMKDAYRSFVTDYADEWRRMFDRITESENLPTVVHCTAGKDRTGFASALVLLALGVPIESVFEDYLLTNYYQQNFFRFVLRWVPLYSFFRTDPEDLLPLLTARREYLQTSIDAIYENYDSIDDYLEKALGVDAAKRERLAALFLK